MISSSVLKANKQASFPSLKDFFHFSNHLLSEKTTKVFQLLAYVHTLDNSYEFLIAEHSDLLIKQMFSFSLDYHQSCYS